MRRGGWALTVVVLAVAAWVIFAPGKPVPQLTRADLAGCYSGGGAEVTLHADGRVRAGDLHGRYHIAPGVRGSRPQAVVPHQIVAEAQGEILVFRSGEPIDRWWITGGRSVNLSVAGVEMLAGQCGVKS